MARNAELVRRVRVSVRQIYVMVAVVLLVDLAVLIAWVVVAPLQYIRTNVSTTLNEASGVMTIETVGSCQSSPDDVSMWAFIAPIIVIHVGSMIVTNVILFKVRGISDRYQEQKYVALASIYICELLLLGLPILIAVQESVEARYIVIAGVIFLTDTGVLALIFVPKIKYAKEGLPEGLTVAESMKTSRPSILDSGSRRGSRRAVSITTVEEIRRRAASASVSSIENGSFNVMASTGSLNTSLNGIETFTGRSSSKGSFNRSLSLSGKASLNGGVSAKVLPTIRSVGVSAESSGAAEAIVEVEESGNYVHDAKTVEELEKSGNDDDSDPAICTDV